MRLTSASMRCAVSSLYSARFGKSRPRKTGSSLPPKDERAELAHAPLADHLAREVGGALDVVAGAGGDLVLSQLLGDAAAHQDRDLASTYCFV